MLPRVLVVVPLHGWAFDNIARQLASRLSHRFSFTVKTLKDLTASERYDLTVTMLWTQADRVRYRLGDVPAVACLFDHASTLREVGQQLFRRMAPFLRLLVVGSPALESLARSLAPDLAARVCQDGVDLEMFRPLPPPPAFTLGWCGNVAIGDGTYKGLELIRAAAERAGVPLVVQDFERRIPHADMPEQFYRRISAYVCASVAEGTPNPVFEALACGRPVITTRVGLTDQVVRPGINGLFVDRTADAIERAIREMRNWEDRSAACREAMEPHGWGPAAERWGDALQAALDSAIPQAVPLRVDAARVD